MILIIGISGSGKTEICKALAKQTKRPWYSSDAYTGATIAEKSEAFYNALQEAPKNSIVELVPSSFLKWYPFFLRKSIESIIFVECTQDTARRRIFARMDSGKGEGIPESATKFQFSMLQKCYSFISFLEFTGNTPPPVLHIDNNRDYYGKAKTNLFRLFAKQIEGGGNLDTVQGDKKSAE